MESVYLAPRILDRIKRSTLLYSDAETGEALVGIIPPQDEKRKFPAMIVLETIPPGVGAIRRWAMFSQGDDWQFDAFNWLNENWELYRQLRRRSYGKMASEKWDLPLRHLGDWHKQPGMVEPSRGDFQTARAILKDQDNDLDFLLTPIVTFADEVYRPVEENTLICADVDPVIRIDFWGLGRRGRWFVPLKPITELHYGLPSLPEVAWWLTDSRRLGAEIDRLERGGYQVQDIVQHNADGMPPLEICFVIYKPGASYVTIAVTPHQYPNKPPQWRTAPLVRPDANQDMFDALFAASQPIPAALTADWQVDRHWLVDGLRMIQTHLEEAQQ